MTVAVSALVLAFAVSCGACEPSPVHLAAAHRDVTGVVTLVGGGASVDQPDANGYTPLHYAVAVGDTELAVALLDRGADINAVGQYGATPLHLAVAANDTRMTTLLAERGAKVSARLEAPGFTKIDPLARKRRPAGVGNRYIGYFNGDEVKVPLTCSLRVADRTVSAVCREGETPLHWAIHRGNPDIVGILLDGKADVDAPAWYGWTPLHEAALRGSVPLATMLLDAGAKHSPRMTNSDPGLTPLTVADICERFDVVRLLRERGGTE